MNPLPSVLVASAASNSTVGNETAAANPQSSVSEEIKRCPCHSKCYSGISTVNHVLSGTTLMPPDANMSSARPQAVLTLVRDAVFLSLRRL
jgi:hypothetical protein